ncbi:MAG: hypothetical protein ACREJD_09525 [Phycisphaerales bacterium]
MSRTDEERLLAAQHAMQTGVLMEMEHGVGAATELKHLRVGVNSAMSGDAAIAELLIAKGVISRDEYFKACADEMEREVKRYEERLSKHLGTNVTLR